MKIPVPGDKFRNTFPDGCVWRVAQQRTGLCDISRRQGHVPFLLGKTLDDSLFAEGFFNGSDQGSECRRLILTEIEDFEERPLPLDKRQGTQDPLNDIVDVGVVATRGAIAELPDRTAILNGISKAVNGEIGALSRPIDGEKTEGDDPESIEIHKITAELLSGNLGSGIRGECLEKWQILPERNGLRESIDRGTRGEKHLMTPREACRFQHMKGSGNIGVDVELGILNGRTDSSPGRKMNNCIRLHPSKEFANRLPVTQIQFSDFNRLGKACDILPFDRRIVEVVEIIQQTHRMTGLGQGANHMGTDEPSSPCDDDLHLKTLSGDLPKGNADLPSKILNQGLFRRDSLSHTATMSRKSAVPTPQLPRRSWVEIDHGALSHNLKVVQKLAGRAGIIAVVKANGYGHGLNEVATTLSEGIAIFAVASLGEALQLRETEKSKPIMLLSAALPSEYAEIAAHGFIPTISSLEEAKLFAKAALKIRPKTSPLPQIHFKIDTGMGRLGAHPAKAEAIVKAITKLPLTLHSISSHLPSADSDDVSTKRQLKRFEHIVQELRLLVPDVPVHVLNSAGTILHAGPCL
jgi:hypothetical protein